MKNLLAILLLIPILSMSQATWAPDGAVWYYNYTNNSATEGYIKVEYLKDSLFNGQNCKVLLKSRHTFNHILEESATDSMGLEFTYEENNQILYYRMNEFTILYDFSLENGNDMAITGLPKGECAELGSVIIDKVENVNINGFDLIKQNIHRTDTSVWDLGNEIIERIGSKSYMFPELVKCLSDMNEGGELRCYYDDEIGWFQVGNQECDYITNINSAPKDIIDISIYPNPTNDSFTVKTNNNLKSHLYILNITGKVLFEDEFSEKINVSTKKYKKGIYIVKVENINNVTIKKIIIE